MCSDRLARALVAAAAAAAATSCRPVCLTFVVHRGAPAVASHLDIAVDVPTKVVTPSRPFLNRFELLDVLTGRTSSPSGDFVDYIEPASDHEDVVDRTWWGTGADQLAAAHLVLAKVHSTTRDDDLLAWNTGAGRPCHATLGSTECLDHQTCATVSCDGESNLADYTFVQSGTHRFPIDRADKSDSKVTFTLHVPPWTDASTGDVTLLAIPTISQPLLTFIDLSDVHVREATATLGDPRQSRGLDHVVDSFERDYEQELYEDVQLQAMVRTINATSTDCVARDGSCPSFVVHNGDAADAGLDSEFDTFHREMDSLDLPWLSVVGNHDVLVFGNFLPGVAIETSALVLGEDRLFGSSWYWPLIAHLLHARWTVSLDSTDCAGCGDQLLAHPPGNRDFAEGFISRHRSHHLGLAKRTIGAQVTNDHGYDLGGDTGYYTFRVTMADQQTLVGIVLDTTDYSEKVQDPGGQGGVIGPTQLAWLGKQIDAVGPGELVMVFGHHPIQRIRVGHDELETLLAPLARSRRLLAYICGHEHQNKVELYPFENTAWWQLQTSSLLAFPQEAKRISIRKLDDKVGFLELLPFTQSIKPSSSSFYHMLERQELGAKRDYCANHDCDDGEPKQDGKHEAVRVFFEFPDHYGSHS